ncbi:MFS transporter [Paraburkholderia sp. BCC1885]|uniref:MFS transporter n=1 Tax=Paraburkholderia sp. BCC1885 TaxID=2562669 RepID=UPI0021B18B00|nr:MFS transporter [Paraburkholderia sp. BCC1885]
MMERVSGICADALDRSDRMPWSALLALATAAFVTILTEALPAGVLSQIAASLRVSESLAGQFVTFYALGCVVATIPLAQAVRRYRQRSVILVAIAGFAIVNAATALSDSYPLTLIARFLAGAISGLLWAQVAGQASRISPAHLRGRAISIAMLGIPAALSFGIPAGTLISLSIGWRATFGIMSGVSLLLIGWVVFAVPDLPRDESVKHSPICKVIGIAGFRSVLGAMVCFVLAHNVLYTYIAPFVAPSGLASNVDVVLLLFGAAALVGMFATGALIDRFLRGLTLASITLFFVATVALTIWSTHPTVVYFATVVWGLAFGGAPALYQTASAHVSGDDADVAQSIVVTTWNAAIAAAGILGGLMLDYLGVAAFAWPLAGLLFLAFVAVFRARKRGFPG